VGEEGLLGARERRREIMGRVLEFKRKPCEEKEDSEKERESMRFLQEVNDA
jgi:hypothetical protein